MMEWWCGISATTKTSLRSPLSPRQQRTTRDKTRRICVEAGNATTMSWHMPTIDNQDKNVPADKTRHERDSRGRYAHIWGVAATIPTEIHSCERCERYRIATSPKKSYTYEQIEAKYPNVQWGS